MPQSGAGDGLKSDQCPHMAGWPMSAIRELRASKHAPCGVCGRANQRCLNYADGGVLCMTHDAPQSKRVDCGSLGDGYYYPPTNTPHRVIVPFPKPVKPTMTTTASLTQRDRIYRALLEQLPLSPSHVQHLTDTRGLQSLDGFGTLPTSPTVRQNACASVHGVLNGVAGLWRNGKQWTCAGTAGILIPYKTPQGAIQGFQIRADDPSKGKYVWWSSAGYPQGTSSGTFCHYTHNAPRLDVWVCEGALKATIASQLTNEAFIGLAGCHLPDVATLVKPLAVLPRFICCPDADYRANATVRQAWIKNTQTLLGHGLDCRVALWEADEGKGIDDVLLACGELPEVTSARAWVQSVS
jgi:hypothetical protein